MKRTLWLAMGVTIGALVVRKVSRTARALTPSGMLGSMNTAAGDLRQVIADFASDVREGMNEREQQLRAGVGIDGKLGAKPEDF